MKALLVYRDRWRENKHVRFNFTYKYFIYKH